MFRQITSRRAGHVIELDICESCGWSGTTEEMILWGTLLVCPLCGE